MKTFTCSYRYAGADWSFEIEAEDFADAEARLACLQYRAELDGELICTIPALPMPGPIAEAFADAMAQIAADPWWLMIIGIILVLFAILMFG